MVAGRAVCLGTGLSRCDAHSLSPQGGCDLLRPDPAAEAAGGRGEAHGDPGRGAVMGPGGPALGPALPAQHVQEGRGLAGRPGADGLAPLSSGTGPAPGVLSAPLQIRVSWRRAGAEMLTALTGSKEMAARPRWISRPHGWQERGDPLRARGCPRRWGFWLQVGGLGIGRSLLWAEPLGPPHSPVSSGRSSVLRAGCCRPRPPATPCSRLPGSQGAPGAPGVEPPQTAGRRVRPPSALDSRADHFRIPQPGRPQALPVPPGRPWC